MTPIRAETAAAATEAAAVLKVGSFRLQANGDIGTEKAAIMFVIEHLVMSPSITIPS